jgi:TPP-dependent pyruvate/acetoin dehydrogenase alpha subunit
VSADGDHGRDVRQGGPAARAGGAARCTCSTRATRFYGGNAIVGGGTCRSPSASALADQMRGEDAVTVCFFGEGAVAEGEFHER